MEIVTPDLDYRILDGEYSSDSWLSRFKTGEPYLVTPYNHVFSFEKKLDKIRLSIEKNSVINITESTVEFLDSRKSMKVDLIHAKSDKTYTFGSYGSYTFTEPILKLKNEGYMLELKSEQANTPNLVIWYGNFNQFGGVGGAFLEELDYDNK